MKRSTITVLLVLLVCVVALGFYRGWFSLSSPGADKGSNKVNLNLTVDPDKVKEDAAAVKKKAKELTDNVTGGEKNPDEHPQGNAKSIDP